EQARHNRSSAWGLSKRSAQAKQRTPIFTAPRAWRQVKNRWSSMWTTETVASFGDAGKDPRYRFLGIWHQIVLRNGSGDILIARRWYCSTSERTCSRAARR